MKKKSKVVCPFCGSKLKYPIKIEIHYGHKRVYPATFVCGTVTSPNWDPPIRGKDCIELTR